MIISDLNYLESVDEEIFGGGGVTFNSNVDKNIDLYKEVYLDVYKDVYSYVDVYGNLATSEASADAYGKDTLAETDTFAQAYEDEHSEAYSQSLAAVY